MKKALDTIKIGSHEKRITSDIVHNISRQIVNRAIETEAFILLVISNTYVNENRTNMVESLTENWPVSVLQTDSIHQIQRQRLRV